MQLLHVTETQARLPAAMKDNTREAGADVKESGLFTGASHLEEGGHVLKPISTPQWRQRFL